MRPIHIEGGRALIDGQLIEASVTLAEGMIATIGEQRPDDALTIDASDLLVLPGIVDIHGDAFERQIMPRPGVRFPLPLALSDTDSQLAAAGITTAFHGLTLSWEPGLRSVDAAVGFLQALERQRPTLSVDHRVQLRLETFAFEAEDVVSQCLQSTPAPALAFNDHTTSTMRKIEEGRGQQLPEWARRAGLSEDDYLARLNDIWKRRSEVRAYVERLATKARDNGIVMLSHDDRTRDERVFHRDLGASIAEFPITEEAIDDAHLSADPTVLGAPNVVRDGSHTHALHAADMIDAGKCTILASDYHYPSMLAAIGRLVETRGHKIEKSWHLISEAPASALGLQDRGRIAPYLRADLVLAAIETNLPPRAIATLIGGKLAHLQGHERLS